MQIDNKQQTEKEIDLLAVMRLLWKRKWVILASALASTIIALLVTILFITPVYSANVTLYANNSSSSGNTSITAQDISVSVHLVDTYAAIILSDPVLDQVIEINGLDTTSQELREQIKITSVNNTEVFRVDVDYSSPEAAANIANSIANLAPIKIADVVEGCSVKIVSNAKVPTQKSSPSMKKALLIGMVIGIAISALTIFIASVLDTRVKGESDLQGWNYPVLGVIPAFAVAEKAGEYGYGYGKKGGQ